MTTLYETALLAGSALLGGALNAVAGGGSFLTFPALVLAGTQPVAANATSTVALWPASLGSAWGYRAELSADPGLLRRFAVLSAVGGLLGAGLLMLTPADVFLRAVPFLLLVATLVFTFGDVLRARLPPSSAAIATAAQFVIAIYGGYFGGGIGLLMLAVFSLMGLSNIHHMNGLKSALGVCINGVAVATFAFAGAVRWPQALLMAVAATLGGVVAARLSRRIPSSRFRPFVVALGWAMTAVFFWKAFR